MQLEGAAKEYRGMSRFHHIMNLTFGETAHLESYYGPVQMCVFGLEYEYTPKNYRIKVECERGFITVEVINEKGLKFSPWMIYPESRYYHFEDRENDVKQLVELTYKAIIDNEIIFMNENEIHRISSTIEFDNK